MHSSFGAPARAAVAYVDAWSSGGPLDRSLRLTVNFHPDTACEGVSMVELLLRDGVYRNQFETGTSNGGLTAHGRGARWRWEHRMFGGVYDDAAAGDRPKYGALNLRRRAAGAAPRFGSAHLRLAEHCLDRATFCFPDSVFEPSDFGTAAHASVLSLAAEHPGLPRTDRAEREYGGRLDDYVEAHIHGVVDVARDVEAIVLDPCYRGTAVEGAARRLPVPLEWHRGFRLSVDELQRHPDFRGPEIVALGTEISRDGRLDARIIGAARSLPGLDPLDVKRVWHCVARFGGPAEQVPSAPSETHP